MRRRLMLVITWGVLAVPCIVPRAHAATLAYWRFEGRSGDTAVDSSGNGNSGDLLNGLAFSTDVFGATVPLTGEPNLYSLSFDGVDDIVVVPDAGSLRPSAAITVEVWAKPQPGARVIVGKQLFPGCCVNSFQLELNPFRFQLTDPSGQGHLIQGPFDPSLGTWHHIAGTWDGRTMRLYLDGVEVASGAFAGPIAYDDNPVLIGGEDDGLGIPGCCLFRGLVDEVRISDEALDPSEFLRADRCDERLGECKEELALCESALEDVQGELERCQSDLRDALATIADLQARLLAAEEEAAELRDIVAQLEIQVVRVEADLRQAFNDPTFTIPGATTLERMTNLANALLDQPRGAKLTLYRSLGGQAGPPGR